MEVLFRFPSDESRFFTKSHNLSRGRILGISYSRDGHSVTHWNPFSGSERLSEVEREFVGYRVYRTFVGRKKATRSRIDPTKCTSTVSRVRSLERITKSDFEKYIDQ